MAQLSSSRVLTAGFAALALTCGLEQPHRAYGTYDEAIAAGEMARGWLPEWVPSAATEIHIQGDLDTNEVWLRFRLPTESSSRLQAGLQRVETGNLSLLHWRRPRTWREWWLSEPFRPRPGEKTALSSDVFLLADAPVGRVSEVAFASQGTLVYVYTYQG